VGQTFSPDTGEDLSVARGCCDRRLLSCGHPFPQQRGEFSRAERHTSEGRTHARTEHRNQSNHQHGPDRTTLEVPRDFLCNHQPADTFYRKKRGGGNLKKRAEPTTTTKGKKKSASKKKENDKKKENETSSFFLAHEEQTARTKRTNSQHSKSKRRKTRTERGKKNRSRRDEGCLAVVSRALGPFTKRSISRLSRPHPIHTSTRRTGPARLSASPPVRSLKWHTKNRACINPIKNRST